MSLKPKLCSFEDIWKVLQDEDPDMQVGWPPNCPSAPTAGTSTEENILPQEEQTAQEEEKISSVEPSSLEASLGFAIDLCDAPSTEVLALELSAQLRVAPPEIPLLLQKDLQMVALGLFLAGSYTRCLKVLEPYGEQVAVNEALGCLIAQSWTHLGRADEAVQFMKSILYTQPFLPETQAESPTHDEWHQPLSEKTPVQHAYTDPPQSDTSSSTSSSSFASYIPGSPSTTKTSFDSCLSITGSQDTPSSHTPATRFELFPRLTLLKFFLDVYQSTMHTFQLSNSEPNSSQKGEQHKDNFMKVCRAIDSLSSVIPGPGNEIITLLEQLYLAGRLSSTPASVNATGFCPLFLSGEDLRNIQTSSLGEDALSSWLMQRIHDKRNNAALLPATRVFHPGRTGLSAPLLAAARLRARYSPFEQDYHVLCIERLLDSQPYALPLIYELLHYGIFGLSSARLLGLTAAYRCELLTIPASDKRERQDRINENMDPQHLTPQFASLTSWDGGLFLALKDWIDGLHAIIQSRKTGFNTVLEAQRTLGNAATRCPYLFQVWLQLSTVYHDAQQSDQAESVWRRARRLAPHNPSQHRHKEQLSRRTKTKTYQN